jgi:protein ImuA
MTLPKTFRRPDPAALESLRARIQGIERRMPGSGPRESDPLPLGAPEIDAALPGGGLPCGVLHEVIGDSGAATGFCAYLLARLAGDTGTVLWCARRHDLYGPGLLPFGLDPSRLVLVHARSATEVLWATEECLRGGAPAAVLADLPRGDTVSLRRLQLAARTGNVTALLLRPALADSTATPAVTRWKITPVTSSSLESPIFLGSSTPEGPARWRVDLLKCRGGTPGSWLVACGPPLPIPRGS